MSSWPTMCCSVLDSCGDMDVGSRGVVMGGACFSETSCERFGEGGYYNAQCWVI